MTPGRTIFAAMGATRIEIHTVLDDGSIATEFVPLTELVCIDATPEAIRAANSRLANDLLRAREEPKRVIAMEYAVQRLLTHGLRVRYNGREGRLVCWCPRGDNAFAGIEIDGERLYPKPSQVELLPRPEQEADARLLK